MYLTSVLFGLCILIKCTVYNIVYFYIFHIYIVFILFSDLKNSLNWKYKMVFLKYVLVGTKISWIQPADDQVHSCTHLQWVNLSVCCACW